MRTTVDIPDELLKRAKRVALEHDSTLRELVTRGLERVITEIDPREGPRRVTFPLLNLSPGCPLTRMTAEDLANIEAEEDAANANAVHSRR